MAHRPAAGVNTYVPLAVLSITAGVRVPLTPLGDVGPSNGAVVLHRMVLSLQSPVSHLD